MKSTKSNNYVSIFKYLMLVPIVLVLVSIIIGAVFNFNLDYDFRKISNFTVKFNTTVTESDYKTLEQGIDKIISDNDISDYRLERVGKGAQNGVFVRIANDCDKLDNKIESIKTTIEDTLLASVESVESDVIVSTSDIGFSLPKNVTKMIWLSVLTFACILLFVFAYMWIRFNLMAGCSLISTLTIEVATLLAAIICFRIPLNTYFVVPFVVMILTTVIYSTIMNNYIKNTLSNEKYDKVPNSERVAETTKRFLLPLGIVSLFIVVAIMVVMFFGGASLIYLGLAIIVGLIIAYLASLYVNTSFWALTYKRDKDTVLKRRIEQAKIKEEQRKAGQKPDDKVVV